MDIQVVCQRHSTRKKNWNL